MEPGAISNATQPKLKRRLFQFSLRTLFIVFTLICVVLGLWIVPKVRRHAEIEAIKSFHWPVGYADAPPDESWLFRRLRDFLPRDFFDDVTSVEFHDCNFTDADLAHLQIVTNLESIWLDDVPITDSGLAYLSSFTNLRQLFIHNIGITDLGSMHLERCTQLHHLAIGDTKIKDANLSQLKGLTQLTWLDLDGNEITDAGLVHLKGLTKLEILSLTRTHVTDEGVAELKKSLPNCDL